MPLTITIQKSSSLRENEIAAMHQLHARYFANARTTTFRADLTRKDWVIRLFDNGRLVGFSTQKLLADEIAGRTVRFLFSGDTIVAHTHWNQPGLAGAFGHLFLRLLKTPADNSLYWFLICKGHRTYRFLPVFFRTFFPALEGDGGVQEPLKALLNRVATRQFGTQYDPARGLIRLVPPRDRLRAAWVARDEGRMHDPYIDYFNQANPDWRRGVELACLTPLSHANMKPTAWRAVRAVTPVWGEGA